MNAELARKLPAVVVRVQPLSREIARVVTVERVAFPRPTTHGTPADWPARLWVPLLCLPGVLLAGLLISLVQGLS